MAIEKKEEKNKICEAVKKYRLMKHLTAKEVSTLTGIAAPNISAIEAGERVPKLDMCKKIASALNVDPVEVCGLELSEHDEKRLLMKLLAKYADNIELDTSDPEIKAVVKLPMEFADFALRYNDHVAKEKLALEGVSEEDPRYELLKANAEDELNYWLEMYPLFDAVNVARRRLEQGTYPHSEDEKLNESRSKGKMDSELIESWSSVLQTEMEPDFWSFQSEYLIPQRNDAWRAKHSKKED